MRLLTVSNIYDKIKSIWKPIAAIFFNSFKTNKNYKWGSINLTLGRVRVSLSFGLHRFPLFLFQGTQKNKESYYWLMQQLKSKFNISLSADLQSREGSSVLWLFFHLLVVCEDLKLIPVSRLRFFVENFRHRSSRGGIIDQGPFWRSFQHQSGDSILRKASCLMSHLKTAYRFIATNTRPRVNTQKLLGNNNTRSHCGQFCLVLHVFAI